MNDNHGNGRNEAILECLEFFLGVTECLIQKSI